MKLSILILIIGISVMQSNGTLTGNSSGSTNSRSTVPASLTFGSLEPVNLDLGDLDSRPIDLIKEDRYEPGSFFFNSGSALLSVTPGNPVTVVLGSTNFTRPFQSSNGNSTEARFSLIADIVQYGETKMAIADFLNNCVREYDFSTDIVSTLVGVCGLDTSFQSRFLEEGETVPALTAFLSAPIELEYVEAGNYLIILDFGYNQIVKYNFASNDVELLGQSLFQALPNPVSLLVDSTGSTLFVTHSYGLSSVNLNTSVVTQVVGERVHDRGNDNRPLQPGKFINASIGKIELLSWLVPDEILAGLKKSHTEALVFIDLTNEVVSTACVGSDVINTTVIGDERVCKVNAPTALTTSNGTVYVATLTEGEGDSYTFTSNSSLYKIRSNERSYCAVNDKSLYQSVRPDRKKYYENDRVRLSCAVGSVVRRCIQDPADPSKFTWNKPIPNCSAVFREYLRRQNRKTLRVRFN